MANEWCAMRVPLLVAKAPVMMNAANCHLIRSSPVEMLLTPPSDPFFAFSAWASYHIIEEMPRHGTARPARARKFRMVVEPDKKSPVSKCPPMASAGPEELL